MYRDAPAQSIQLVGGKTNPRGRGNAEFFAAHGIPSSDMGGYRANTVACRSRNWIARGVYDRFRIRCVNFEALQEGVTPRPKPRPRAELYIIGREIGRAM